ncbi:ABC transporter permease [Clostridia bacterium]|nr:ABC transporter permease [Clostridia bacterium]
MDLMKKLVLMARHHWRTVAVASLGIIGASLLNLITPKIVQMLTAGLTPDDTQVLTINLNQLVIFAIVLVAAYLLRAGCRWVALAIAHVAAWNFVGELTSAVYNKLQTLSMRYYQDKSTGQLMSRMINDTRSAEVLVAHALPDLISNVVVILGVAILIFLINPLLAAITLIPVPFVFWAGTFFSKKVLPLFKINQQVLGDLNSVTQENLSGMKEIQAFSQEDRENAKMAEICRNYSDVNIRANYANAVFHPGIEFLTSMGTVIVVGIGGYFAMEAVLGVKMPISDVIAFLMYLGIFYGPLAVLSRLFEDVQTTYASTIRVFEVLDAQSEVVDSESAGELPENCTGEIEFDRVTFAYNENEPVLKEISFTASPGQMVAVVGATGAGKTTIVSLLERFYDPVSGQVKIDGVDIKSVSLASLRSQISMVLQDVFLFSGTIADNIGYSVKGATREQITEAAKIACAHDFIDAMPNSYDTIIGERGTRLSGGQKQRISIARAVLKKTPILILDEATSSVDMETELQIQQAIENLTGERTIIVIAHRLSTIMAADQILVLSEGTIAERGSYAELMERGGTFARMNKRNK